MCMYVTASRDYFARLHTQAENTERAAAAAAAAVRHKITSYHEASMPPHAGSGLSAVGRGMPKRSDHQNGREK